MKNNKTKLTFPVIDGAITVYLRRNNMTQAYLAHEMGMAENTFSWKRRGIREWTMSEAVKLCDILGLTLDQAAGRTATKKGM